MQEARPDRAAVQRALEEAVLEVLETMCFEFPADEPSAGEPAVDGTVQAVARFAGSARGALRVALAGEAPRRLAAAFLGMDETEVGAQKVLQMASELANMLCGATLSRLAPHGRLRIATPEAGWGGEPSGGGGWLRFPLEGGEVAVTLKWEEES